MKNLHESFSKTKLLLLALVMLLPVHFGTAFLMRHKVATLATLSMAAGVVVLILAGHVGLLASVYALLRRRGPGR